MSKEGSQNQQIVVFKLGTEEYGLEIDKIKEVVLTPQISRVPLAEKYIVGVANVRGNILAIIDLEIRFGLKTSQDSLGFYTLVIDDDKAKAGVLVREVPNTLSVPESAIEPASATLQEFGTEQRFIKSIVKIGNRLIFLIDIFSVISKDLISQTIS
jgi:purine-binding chemotaxis protein CheW